MLLKLYREGEIEEMEIPSYKLKKQLLLSQSNQRIMYPTMRL